MTTRAREPARRRDRRSGLIDSLSFLLPFCLGLAIVFGLPQFGLAGKFGGVGHDGYLELATSLYQGHGYRFEADGAPALHRPPLYPVLLTPFMGLSAEGVKVAVVALNSLFLFAACVYVRRICGLLFPQPAVGTIAVALLLCNPWIYRLVGSPLAAIMQMALYATLSFYFLRFCAHYRRYAQLPARALAPGFLKISLLTTAMCLAHGTSVYVCSAVMAAAAVAMLVKRQWKLLGFLCLTASLTLAALTPWALRNQHLLERVELSSSGAGFTYFLGNIYWGVDTADYRDALSTEHNALRLAGVTQRDAAEVAYWGVLNPQVDEQLRGAMIAHAAARPGALAQKALLNAADIYFPITHTVFCLAGGQSAYCRESLSPYQAANRAARTLLMLLIVAMALQALRGRACGVRPELRWLAIAGVGLHTLPYLPIATYAHHGIYSLGAMPLLCALAAGSIYRARVLQALRTPQARPEDVWADAAATPATPALPTRERAIRAQTQAELSRRPSHRRVDLHLG